VLARLNRIPGLEDAAVDHRGELLRLIVVEATVLESVRREISALGYQAEPVSGLTASHLRWYAFDDVRDLSREEAEIIARRVTSLFMRSHALSDAEAVRLEHAATDALYACLAANQLGSGVPAGALRTVCCDAVETAARPVIGDDAAREYVALLSRDLAA